MSVSNHPLFKCQFCQHSMRYPAAAAFHGIDCPKCGGKAGLKLADTSLMTRPAGELTAADQNASNQNAVALPVESPRKSPILLVVGGLILASLILISGIVFAMIQIEQGKAKERRAVIDPILESTDAWLAAPNAPADEIRAELKKARDTAKHKEELLDISLRMDQVKSHPAGRTESEMLGDIEALNKENNPDDALRRVSIWLYANQGSWCLKKANELRTSLARERGILSDFPLPSDQEVTVYAKQFADAIASADHSLALLIFNKSGGASLVEDALSGSTAHAWQGLNNVERFKSRLGEPWFWVLDELRHSAARLKTEQEVQAGKQVNSSFDSFLMTRFQSVLNDEIERRLDAWRSTAAKYPSSAKLTEVDFRERAKRAMGEYYDEKNLGTLTAMELAISLEIMLNFIGERVDEDFYLTAIRLGLLNRYVPFGPLGDLTIIDDAQGIDGDEFISGKARPYRSLFEKLQQDELEKAGRPRRQLAQELWSRETSLEMMEVIRQCRDGTPLPASILRMVAEDKEKFLIKQDALTDCKVANTGPSRVWTGIIETVMPDGTFAIRITSVSGNLPAAMRGREAVTLKRDEFIITDSMSIREMIHDYEK